MAEIGLSQEASFDRSVSLPLLTLDDLLGELQTRLTEVRATHRRVRMLLDSVLVVGSGLELDQVLRRIVEAATELVDAKYGALGVVAEDGTLSEFITVGIDRAQIKKIGDFPSGHGILGTLIKKPEVLRLIDLSAHPSSVGFPEHHPPMRSFLGVPIRVRESVFGNLYLTEKREGREFTAEDENVLAALAAAAGVAIENARLYQRTRQRERSLDAGAQVNHTLLSGASSTEALEFITNLARQLSSADLVALLVPVPEENELVVHTASGKRAEGLTNKRLPMSDTLAGAAFRTGTTIIADSLPDKGKRFAAQLGLGLGRGVCAPLGQDATTRGALVAWRDDQSHSFSDDEISTLTAFATQAAVTLELAERRRDAELLRIFEDRDRIARDLHDSVIQRLFATGMALDGITKRIGDPVLAERLSQAVNSLDETIKEIRTSIFELQHRNARQSIRESLRTLARDLASHLGFRSSVIIEGPLDSVVSSELAGHMLAVVREGLSNVGRHASASNARVQVLVTPGKTLAVRVKDDGCGFSEPERRSGLDNLERRARLFNGSLTVETPDTGGTELVWEVPV